MNKNYAIALGVIDSPPKVVEGAFQRMFVSISGIKDGVWGKIVTVIFSSDSLIKRSRGLHEGDVILITGIPGTDASKAAIFANDFIVISKNKFKVSEEMRRPALSEYSRIRNIVEFYGVVVHCENDRMGIMVDNSEIIRGCDSESIALNVAVQPDHGISPGENIHFFGEIANGEYRGKAYRIQGGTD